MLTSKNHANFWVLPAFIVLLAVFFYFKPESYDKKNHDAVENHATAHIIRIASPDLSASKNNSTANALVDHIYLNKILEKEFAKENIKVEWNFFKGAGPAINEALANKQIDIAYLGDLAAIIGKSNGLDTKIIAATGRNNPSYLGVLPNKGYDSLEKLKGKQIGVWQGTAYQLSFNKFLKSQGYRPEDFKIVNLDTSAANAALAAKKIDATWGLIPVLALKKKGLAEVPLSTHNNKDGSGTMQSVFIARTDFLKENPALAQKFTEVLVDSYQWIANEENRAKAVNQVTSNAGFPKDLYEENIKNLALKDIYSPDIDLYFKEQLKTGIEEALDAKLIQKNINIEDWVDDHLIKESLKYE